MALKRGSCYAMYVVSTASNKDPICVVFIQKNQTLLYFGVLFTLPSVARKCEWILFAGMLIHNIEWFYCCVFAEFAAPVHDKPYRHKD